MGLFMECELMVQHTFVDSELSNIKCTLVEKIEIKSVLECMKYTYCTLAQCHDLKAISYKSDLANP